MRKLSKENWDLTPPLNLRIPIAIQIRYCDYLKVSAIALGYLGRLKYIVFPINL
jgi:hypothetical protein